MNLKERFLFRKYWESLGKPQIETKFPDEDDSCFEHFADNRPPKFNSGILDYRLKGDIHWKIRRDWVLSGFELPIQCSLDGNKWDSCGKEPLFLKNYNYRVHFGDSISLSILYSEMEAIEVSKILSKLRHMYISYVKGEDNSYYLITY